MEFSPVEPHVNTGVPEAKSFHIEKVADKVTDSVKNSCRTVTKQEERQEAVKRVQQAFLINIGDGKNARQAFFDSLSAMNGPVKKDEDTFERTQCTEGSLGKIKVDPEQIKKWLQIIDRVIPIMLQIIDLLPKN